MTQTLKFSEARILVFLYHADKSLRNPMIISAKLGYGYSYVALILRQMELRRWIKRIDRGRKCFYETINMSLIEEAIIILKAFPDTAKEADGTQLKLTEVTNKCQKKNNQKKKLKKK